MDTTHQATALTVKVGVYFLLESCLVEVTAANGDTKSNSFLLGMSCNILVDSNGRVDTAALTEQRSNSSARSFGRNEDNINIFWNLNLCKVLEDRGEAVREV